jgi:membrane protein required for colicin V production
MIEGGLDIALLVILGYFILRGLFRGVVKEVVAVLGLFVAFWVASVYWPLGELHLKPIFDLPGQRGITSFIIIFVIIYFFISLLSIFVDKVVKMTITPVASSLLGAVVGVIKGTLVCGIILSGAQVFLKDSEPFFQTSKLWPYLAPVTSQAKAWMPEGLRQALASAVKNLPSIGGGPPPAAAGPPPAALPASLDAVDWKTIRNILQKNPETLTPAWREKLRNISGGEALSPEDLKRFISDHPALFAKPPAPNKPATAPIPAAPSWPQPATE